ncbi:MULTISPECIES: RnfH family protein [unclassified Alteromonas]|jgi:putative ubiquitin-RnfH superfamily antitoxin RatB of RatAB toxin-antitoxin module|uniref:RnfH family protein n=1 Tax=unclassified Alteromonas TaxID=2614992 RepID=UPI0022B360AC|nr:RnfH family protein [Alteromonas sp. BMJM2]
MSSELITVEVAYALPTKQSLVSIAIDKNATVEEAIQASNLLHEYPDIDLSKTKVGVWSRVVRLKDTLIDGDRIEIYRGLIADPKEIRKRRAEKAKEEGRADKVTGGKVNPLKAK